MENEMSIDELKYFKLHFLKRKSENIVMNEMNLNRRRYDVIKKSCVIKMALFFKIVITK